MLKISIITVSLNAEKTIERTIKSIISQKYSNLEYIVIDGSSKDKTLEIIEKYKKFIDIQISERDYGLYDAMNKGIRIASGDIIGIINADDFLYPDALIKVSKGFKDQNYSDSILIGDMFHDGRIIKGWRPKSRYIGAFAAHPPMFIPSKVYQRVGLYNVNYKILADYDLMYRAFNLLNIKPIYIEEVLVNFEKGGLASRNIFRSFTEEMLIKIDHGQNLSKVFCLYLLKLLRFNFKKIFYAKTKV